MIQTSAKITANNDINNKLTAMFADGQAIFRNNSDKANLFTFDYVLGLISSPGTAGVKGTVTPDAAVQAGVTVGCAAQNKTTVPDDTGKYSLSLQSGNGIIVTASALGFVSESKTVDVPVGTFVTVNFTLIANPPPPDI